MKKLNLLLPLTTVCFTPIIALTSCANNDAIRTVSIKSLFDGSFKRNTEVIPISEQKKFTQDEAAAEYFKDADNNLDILIDDICDSIVFYKSKTYCGNPSGSLSFEVYDINNGLISIRVRANNIQFGYYDIFAEKMGMGNDSMLETKIDGSVKVEGLPILFSYNKSYEEQMCKWCFKFDFNTILDDKYDQPWNINASIQASQTSEGVTEKANINGEFNNNSDASTLQILKNFIETFLGKYITTDLYAKYFENVQFEPDPED